MFQEFKNTIHDRQPDFSSALVQSMWLATPARGAATFGLAGGAALAALILVLRARRRRRTAATSTFPLPAVTDMSLDNMSFNSSPALSVKDAYDFFPAVPEFALDTAWSPRAPTSVPDLALPTCSIDDSQGAQFTKDAKEALAAVAGDALDGIERRDTGDAPFEERGETGEGQTSCGEVDPAAGLPSDGPTRVRVKV